MQASASMPLSADDQTQRQATHERQIASASDTIVTIALMFAFVMPVLLWLKSAAF